MKINHTPLLLLAAIFLAFAGLSSCSSKLIAPEYTSVDKINNLEKDMDIGKTIKTLGCNPYNYYYSDEEGTKTLFFYYKYKERKMKPSLLEKRVGLALKKDETHLEYFKKVGNLYVTFKDGRLYQVSSEGGLLESRNLLMYENTIKEMKTNEEDFIDPGEESRSLNKDITLDNSRAYAPPSGTGSIQNTDRQKEVKSSILNFLKKPESDVTVQKKKSPPLAFALSFVVPGLGEFYAKSPVRGALFGSMAIAGAVMIPVGLNSVFQYTDSPVAIAGTALLGAAWIVSIFDAPRQAKKYNKKQQSLLAKSPFYYSNENMALHFTPVGGPGFAGGSFSMRF